MLLPVLQKYYLQFRAVRPPPTPLVSTLTTLPSWLKHDDLALSPLVNGDSRDEQKQCVCNMPFVEVMEVTNYCYCHVSVLGIS
jgi:hypothetical protein